MVFEHFAINVDDSIGRKNWYCSNLGLKVVTEMDEAPFTVFLADSSDRIVCEFYSSDDAPIIDYKTQHDLTFHFAFVSQDAKADKARLMAAGCSYVGDARPNETSHLVMLRDPWGLPLQLCQRLPALL